MKFNNKLFKRFAYYFVFGLASLFGGSCDEGPEPGVSISGFSPASGKVGDIVVISGSGFSTTLSENVVQFNGGTASVSAVTANELTVIVPSEAATGKVKVTVNGKSAESSSDFEISTPVISSIYPTIGAANVSVVIKGNNFSTAPNNNFVLFNGVRATVTEAKTDQLTVKVPLGATTGKVSVRVGSTSTTSADDFVICNSAELFVSDITINTINSEKTSFSISFRVTNLGAASADLSKAVVQNYVSSNSTLDSGDPVAGGFVLQSGGTLHTGQSHLFSWTCNVQSGTITTYPYLLIELYDSPDGSVSECSTTNNVTYKLIQ